jgi:hypothetical protein
VVCCDAEVGLCRQPTLTDNLASGPRTFSASHSAVVVLHLSTAGYLSASASSFTRSKLRRTVGLRQYEPNFLSSHSRVHQPPISNHRCRQSSDLTARGLKASSSQSQQRRTGVNSLKPDTTPRPGPLHPRTITARLPFQRFNFQLTPSNARSIIGGRFVDVYILSWLRN